MHDIFLSYASADLLRVQPLIRALQDHGWSVWWDRTIPPGQTFDQVIQAALDASRCVMVVWSQAAVVSDWVREEATEGRERHILIPVMLDEVRLPLGFRQIQAARLFHWQGDRLDTEFVRIVQAVTLLIGEPRGEAITPAHTVPQDTEAVQASRSEPLPGAEIAEEPDPKADTGHDQSRREAKFIPGPAKRTASRWVWLATVGVLLIAVLWLVIPRSPTPPTVRQSETEPLVPTPSPSATYALTIKPSPADSKVTLLHSQVPYRPGVRLEPGTYRFRLSKPTTRPGGNG